MSTPRPRRPDPSPPARQATLGFLLRALYDDLQGEVYAAVARSGHPDVREVHSPVLRHITPDGIRVSEVARRCGYAKQSIAYVVDDLASLGYVTTEPDPEDGRAKRIRLTTRGEDLIACLLAQSRVVEKSLARKIGPRAVEALRSGLTAALADAESGGPPIGGARPSRPRSTGR